MVADGYTSSQYDQLFRREGAARYVQETYGFPCSPQTLAKLACVSSHGPPFHKAGRFPLYPKTGLDDWAQSKIGPLVRSSSESSVHRADTGPR
jgi:hypothetical protein